MFLRLKKQTKFIFRSVYINFRRLNSLTPFYIYSGNKIGFFKLTEKPTLLQKTDKIYLFKWERFMHQVKSNFESVNLIFLIGRYFFKYINPTNILSFIRKWDTFSPNIILFRKAVRKNAIKSSFRSLILNYATWLLRRNLFALLAYFHFYVCLLPIGENWI